MSTLVTTDTALAVQISIEGVPTASAFKLNDGESALIGSAPGCQLRVEEDLIAPHQCLLELKDGTLILHNWSDDNSTLVNGTAIQDEVELEYSDVVTLGNQTLAIDYLGVSPEIEASQPAVQTVERPEPRKSEESVDADSVASQTVGILHAEITFLHREIELRDQRIAELGAPLIAPDDEEVSLTARKKISELTEELELADAKRLNLMDELQALEELRHAENEERKQLTVWVNEIEELIARREEELRAEMECLEQKLASERQHRKAQERRADDNATGTASVKQKLADLREDHEALREQLDSANDELAKMNKECLNLRAANTEAAIDRRVHEAVRQERLNLAQERAAISRQEHELVRKLREAEFILEKQSRGEIEKPVNDLSVPELRATLADVETPKASLGQRLVEIWDRLDGPTDRD